MGSIRLIQAVRVVPQCVALGSDFRQLIPGFQRIQLFRGRLAQRRRGLNVADGAALTFNAARHIRRHAQRTLRLGHRLCRDAVDAAK